MEEYMMGVDIGGTTVKLGLFLTDGKLLDHWEIPTRLESDGRYILGDIAESIDRTLEQKGISKRNVQGVGVGVPGPVGSDGTVLKCVNLGWGVFNVEQELNGLTGLKTRAGNDANAAALGEMWQGGGRGYQDAVLVTLGTGIGGGVIIGGKILYGCNGAAGEIGHIPMVDGETDVCGCGKRGCLEQYASANGAVRVAKRFLAKHSEMKSKLNEIETLTSKEIFEAAAQHDAAATEIVREVGRLLGKGLATVACAIDPQVFVIGGGMSKAGEPLLDAIRGPYREYAFHASRNTEFRLAELGNMAGIYGCAKMALE